MKKKKKEKINRGKSEHNGNNTPSLILSIVALLLSAISVFYAFKSFDLSRLQDEESKTAIWLGAYKDQEMTFSSSNNEIKMQKGYVLFPSQLDSTIGYINPPEYSISMIPTETALIDFVDQMIERKERHYLVTESYIPMVIQSSYVVAGEARHIQSVYNVQFTATLSEKENAYKLPEIHIRGMWFDHHLNYQEDARIYLDKLWDELLQSTS